MPYLETEEEAAEKIADSYERKKDYNKEAEKKKNMLTCLI